MSPRYTYASFSRQKGSSVGTSAEAMADMTGSPLLGRSSSLKSVFPRIEKEREPQKLSNSAHEAVDEDKWAEIPASVMGYTYYRNCRSGQTRWVLPHQALEARILTHQASRSHSVDRS